MKNLIPLLFALLMFSVPPAQAGDVVLDPGITPTYTFGCTLPIARADGTPLALSEIATVEFYRSDDGLSWTSPIGTSQTCDYVEDLTAINPQKWYYTAMVTDTEGRTSGFGNTTFLDLQLVHAPAAITDLH